MPDPVAIQFTEKMRGYVSFEETAYQDGYERGKADNIALMFQLTIRAVDVDRFVNEGQHAAEACGYVECESLGGRCPVERGLFNLFVESANSNERRMLYRLYFHSTSGQPTTLSGFKRVQNEVGPDIWKDTTTLYVNLFKGHCTAEEESTAEIVGTGIVRIEPFDFIEQLTTIRAFGPTLASRVNGIEKFGRLFLGSLWDVYGSMCIPGKNEFEREIPLFTTEGVTGANISTHPFTTADRLGLSLLRFKRQPCRNVVVIIHGLTTSSDMFIMPEHYNLVQYLLDHGYEDVWTLDFRMSNRFPYNLHRHRYNMDDIALYDFPPALAKIREACGSDVRIHVICHCLGSVSFMMSLFGKAVDGIASVISNSVALTPRIKPWSRLKLTLGPLFVENFTSIPYLNPYWRREPGFGIGKLLGWLVSLYHRECNVPECHMLSFMWGTGFPAVYRHENLHDITHRRGGDLYGGVSLHYYRHVRKMVAASNTAVKFDPNNPKYKSLPDDYFEHAAEISTPILFITGQQNDIFLNSNIICFQRLNQVAPGRHELAVFPNYGHQDVFMGKNNHIDVFPRLVEFLDKHSDHSQRSAGATPIGASP